MPETRAEYSCDTCRSRKVACSRDQSGCQRCKAEGIVCTYSRSGVIRRNRRRKKQQVEAADGLQPPPHESADASDASTHARLRRLVGKDHRSLGVLASLLGEHAAAWQDSSAFDALAEGAQRDYFRFEEGQVRAWFDVFIATLQKEKLLVPSSQSDLLEQLLESRPRQLQDRAWFVMFYSITLSTKNNNNTLDASTKLRSNLWLAFNDVRLLLEPAMSSVQALLILACYAEEFMTPLICWMLVSKACMILQAIGITRGRLDSAMGEQRNMFFWRLNTLDKALALVLCKPPTFSREMMAGIPMPSLEQLLPPLPGYSSVPVLFDAHYMHQMHLMSNVMADVWRCLYGQDSHKVLEVKKSVERWHRQATEVLEAAALAEKPILPADVAILVDFGLETLHYHYYSLLVLITVSSKQLRTQSTYPSQQLLRLLPSLSHKVTSLRQPYCCLLWQQLHCPLAAFGTLWGEIVVKGEPDSRRTQESVEAIEYLPPYLLKLSSRNSLAIKLARIVEKIVQNSKLILSAQVEPNNQTSRPENRASPKPDRAPLGTDEPNQQSNAPFQPRTAIEMPEASAEDVGLEIDSLFPWPDDGFLNATVDWFTWGNEDLS